jgi:uncharacterized metal-binding protein YceD (DUF177 family)
VSGGALLWPEPVRLAEIARFTPERPLVRHLDADAGVRDAIAREFDLVALDRLEADLELSAWFDGVQVEGRWRASIVQTCGISLEPFASELSGAFRIRAVLRDSPVAPAEDVEVVIDPDAEDPPDMLDDDVVDLGAYVVEHLVLDIDPFPRKPGSQFESPATEENLSPFAVLKTFKPLDPPGRT